MPVSKVLKSPLGGWGSTNIIMPERILITGASGNVGLETLRELMHHPGHPNQFTVTAGVRNPVGDRDRLTVQPDGFVRLDFEDPATFAPALTGIDRVLLVRPPQLADVTKYFAPFVQAMKQAGTKQVAFLSLQGVDNNPVTPHHKIEELIFGSGIPYTMLRPSFFMQNLSTTHRNEIRDRSEIFVPAGNGRTSFVDVRDIGAVAALALTDPKHLNQAYELTGSEALTYGEVAHILTEVLGRRITYANPSLIRFIWQKWQRERNPIGFVLIMVALYTVAKLGKAARLTNTTEQLLGRKPITFYQFASDFQAAWR